MEDKEEEGGGGVMKVQKQPGLSCLGDIRFILVLLLPLRSYPIPHSILGYGGYPLVNWSVSLV